MLAIHTHMLYRGTEEQRKELESLLQFLFSDAPSLFGIRIALRLTLLIQKSSLSYDKIFILRYVKSQTKIVEFLNMTIKKYLY